MSDADIDQLIDRAARFIVSRQHDRAIALLAPALAAHDDRRLARQLALAYGGKAEHLMQRADQLMVPPSEPELRALESWLGSALAADPTLGDPHWDLAVINGRFRRDFAAARRHLDEAKALGYAHPMMGRLEVMVRGGEMGAAIPPEQPPGSPAAIKLRELILHVISAPIDEGIFAGYCADAIEIVREGDLPLSEFEQIRTLCARLGGDDSDYVSDLLRIVAREFGDPDVLKDATEAHLTILANGSFSLIGDGNVNRQQVERALRVARRGIEVVEKGGTPVDPEVHAQLRIALGQAYSHRTIQQVRAGMEQYDRALALKQSAGNDGDAERLRSLLGRMIDHLLKGAYVPVVGGGLGRVYDDLTVAHGVAQRLGNERLDIESGIALGSIQREVRRPQEAENVMRRLLTLAGLTKEQRVRVRLELASALSEQKKGAEAAALQEEVLRDLGDTGGAEERGTIWLNLGNSRREAGDAAGARTAFETALETIPVPDLAANEMSSALRKRAAATALLAQLDFMEGHPDRGHQRFVESENMLAPKRESMTMLDPVDLVHLHSIAARTYANAGMRDRALDHLQKARENLRRALGHGPSVPVWESMFQQWSDLDALQVKLLLADDAPASRESALSVAESAKGRLLAWLARMRDRNAGYDALEPGRTDEAIARFRAWAGERPRRRVISLFAGTDGLAVMSIGAGGDVSGRWEDAFDYQKELGATVTPWEAELEAAAAGDDDAWGRAGEMTERLLGRAGELIERAVPDIAQGGDELIIVPHRLFRNLPLMHCRLADGRRLSDAFREITIVSMLTGAQATDALDNGESIAALADSDGTLPFARMEGLAVAGVERTHVGGAVTTAQLRDAIASGRTLLISCHGLFDADNPWVSSIRTADGDLALHDVLTEHQQRPGGVVVLGVCEAGRSRRTASDEPIGFPGLLILSGVSVVVAPLWPVDELAALLFVTRLFGSRRQLPTAEAVARTAGWLRTLTVAETQRELDALVTRLEATSEGVAAIRHARPQLDESRAWLADCPSTDTPFSSPVDWAAFQVTRASM